MLLHITVDHYFCLLYNYVNINFSLSINSLVPEHFGILFACCSYLIYSTNNVATNIFLSAHMQESL